MNILALSFSPTHSIIVQNILFSIVVTFLIIFIFYTLWKKYLHNFLPVLILVTAIDLFFFSRGNLLTTNFDTVESKKPDLDPGLSRVLSTSDFVDYTGLHVYWNHLRVRRPFAPDLGHSELDNFERLKRELNQLPANTNIQYQFFSPSGYSAVVLKNYAKYWNSDLTNSVTIPSSQDGRLNFLGVEYLITGFPDDYLQNTTYLQTHQNLDYQIYQNPQSKPRAFFIKSKGTVEIIDYQPTKVTLKTSSTTPNTLVFSDAYYPGWQAKVNSQPQKILPFSDSFRQLKLEPGNHTIHFFYRPKSLIIGSFFTIIALLITGSLILWPNQKLD